ncbi:MAG: AAA family ATPase, partial [Sandaracinaceae bacterium]
MNELPPLPIETVLAVRELESGHVLVSPIARLAHAAYDEEANALVSMELFLAELLRRAGAPLSAAFSLPQADIELVHVEVELPEARETVGRPLSYAMPCVVLPHRKSRWLLVLPLAMTVHVARGEDLDAIVGEEASRRIAALAPSGWERLAWFGARETRLERLTVSVERRGIAGDEAAVKNLRAKLDRAHRRKKALDTLRAVGRQVHAADLAGPEPVGTQAPLRTFTALMSGDTRRSVVLVGEAGVGKSALVAAWLRQDPDRWLFTTSAAQLVAGMSFLGQWQERIRRVMEAAETLDAVLWLDDLRDLLGSRSASVDLAAAIRPWLDDGRVRLVGELTPEAADLFATRQAGLFAAMHPLALERQDRRAATEALERAVAWAEANAPDRPALRRDAIGTVVELTERFVPYRPFPAKAIRLYEELRAAVERAHSAAQTELGPREVYEGFSRQTGIPEFLLRDDVAWRTERARELLARRIVGQHEAVKRVVDVLAVVKAGLSPGDRPLASFLFVGPTGVGKTALARALAELIFGSADRLVRFDMSELADPGAAERLLRGVGDEEGRLTSVVRRQPFTVVLLDEIEKAHPSVFDLLLGVLGEGRLTDARGRTAFFHDVLLIMTSNLGTRHRTRPLGIDPPKPDEHAHYARAVDEHFRPELVNRIDRIVPFAPLGEEEIRRVAELVTAQVAGRWGLRELGVRLAVSDAALDRLAADGYDAAYGARALRRRVEDGLVAPLARALGPVGVDVRGASAVVRADEELAPPRVLGREARGAIVVEILPRTDGALAGEALDALEAIAARRRWVQEQSVLPSVVEQRERHDYLLADLSYGKQRPSDVGVMQRELHALRERLAAIDEASDELSAIEELALATTLAGEGADALLEDARAAELGFRAALLDMLLGADARHQCTVLVREDDGERPLDRWLGQLLEALPRLEWRLTAHVHNDSGPRPATWPTERKWGPARTPAELAERLARPDRGPMSVILRVRGRH